MTWCDLLTLFLCAVCGVYQWRLWRLRDKLTFQQYMNTTTFAIIKANLTQEQWNKWVHEFKQKEPG
jgi:hypothetical protein